MIARVSILLPFEVFVAADVIAPYEEQRDGRLVRVYPPYRTLLDPSALDLGSSESMVGASAKVAEVEPSPAWGVSVGGKAAAGANALKVDVVGTFSRRRGATNPPIETAFAAANAFTQRLRVLTRAGQAQVVDPMSTVWHAQYLRDDGTPLRADKRYARGSGASSWHWRLLAIDNPTWSLVQSVPSDYEPPPWEELLTDAKDLLPRRGPAIVLAASAVETRVAAALSFLAPSSGLADVWDWLNDRQGDYRKTPSLVERADVLMKTLSGASLKEDATLWTAFSALRKARNTYVHEGRLEDGGVPIDRARAEALVESAAAIIDWVDARLPESERRPARQTGPLLEILKPV